MYIFSLSQSSTTVATCFGSSAVSVVMSHVTNLSTLQYVHFVVAVHWCIYGILRVANSRALVYPRSRVCTRSHCVMYLEYSIHTIFLNSFSLCFSSTTTVVLHFCIVQLNPYTPSSIPFPFLNKMIETFQCHTNEQKDDHHEQCQYKNDHKD